MGNKKNTNEETAFLSSVTTSKNWGDAERNYGARRENIEVAQLQEELDSKKQDREQRKEYANKIYVFLCIYIVIVFVLLFFNGFNLTSLDNSVLIAIITTMTANIIGIFIFVAKYLFHTKE